ncbi:MAG: FHA domain-containing protein [Fibrobacterales bacterium]
MEEQPISRENRIIAFNQGSADQYGEYRIKILFPVEHKQECKFSESVSIGRGSSNDIILKDEWLSRSHCKIFVENHEIFVEDLGSTNGTVVNGMAAYQRIKLNQGDEIELGQIIIVVEPCLESVVEESAQEEVSEVTVLSGVMDNETFWDSFCEQVTANENQKAGSSLLCIKIDSLKELMATHEEIIKEFLMLEISRYLNNEKLSDEIVGRYDDCFLYYLQGVDQEKAASFAEYICKSIKQHRFMYNQSSIELTISIGLAHQNPGERPSPENLYRVSQLAGNQAQEDGGNVVMEQPCYE